MLSALLHAAPATPGHLLEDWAGLIITVGLGVLLVSLAGAAYIVEKRRLAQGQES